ncbi:hypothetical protein SAMN05421811_112126 [Nonomuraea wenchangensis]|uniref:WD40-like Beta Propeller Repeat n=2 Tax=Nonomuraea wenchangensis TaxID=568860 RepID=A0A1I0L544_9ACTN|nr:hypothetical protein SAMN05421811_112126 [Nonomuraea wenchangensis]
MRGVRNLSRADGIRQTMGFHTSLAALTLAGLTAAAQPATADAPATIAYAQRMQTWEVVLTSGKVVEVPEALTVAPKDAVNEGERAPFLVSGDGRHIFYYRKTDGLFVERTVHGKERVVAKGITAYAIGEEWPFVSYDGSYVVMGTAGPGLGVFADLRTREAMGPPEKTDSWSLSGFSPDSKRLLLGGEQMVVFDRALRPRLRLKTRLEPSALAGDSTTSAVLVGKPNKYRKVRLLNLRTGRAGTVVKVKLPRGRYIDDIDFDRSDRLIVRSRSAKGVAVYQVSPRTGAVKPLKEIERPDAAAWVLPGDDGYEPWTERK